MENILISLLPLLIMLGCQPSKSNKNTPISGPDPYEHIVDLEAQRVLKKAVERSGGFDLWRNKKSWSFDKQTNLYMEAGEVEKSTFEHHNYQYDNGDHVKISWSSENKKYKIESTNGDLSKTINGRLDESSDITSLNNKVQSSVYAISLPFKLLNPDIHLAYLGIDTIANLQTAHVLQAKYQPTSATVYDTDDIWWHYFSTIDFRQIGYKVQHADHVSFIENLSFIEKGGFAFPTNRKSWRMDKEGSLLYLRADYEYSGFRVE